MSAEISPGTLWYSPENRCTYEILNEPSQYAPDMILAVIRTSPARARGRYGARPLKGDRVHLRLDDFGQRIHPCEER